VQQYDKLQFAGFVSYKRKGVQIHIL